MGTSAMPKVQAPSGRLAETVVVDFESEAEPWSTYKLSDGSVLKIRVIVKSVMRLEGEFDQGGNPLYVVGADTASRVVKSKIRGEPSTISTKPAKHDPSVG